MLGHQRRQDCILAHFRHRQDRIEPFTIKIVKPDLMTVSRQGLDHGLGNGRIKAGRIRMGQDYQNLHR